VIFMRGVVAIGAVRLERACGLVIIASGVRPGTPKARLRGEKSLAFGPDDDIHRDPRPQQGFA
jgi:hypothetical protein